MQVRKSGRRLKGPRRNLIDMGYGVSQVLPVITELLQEEASPMFLLQQPEVHLTRAPRRLLGSLFCRVAGPDCQLIVETHGDHLLEGDVRDGVSDQSDDVSILYFERDNWWTFAHSPDSMKRATLGAPSYGKFFGRDGLETIASHRDRMNGAIIDANVVHEVFGSYSQGERFFDWIEKGQALFGGRLREELEASSEDFRKWATEPLSRGGRGGCL